MVSELLRLTSWVPLIPTPPQIKPTPPMSPFSLSLFKHYQIIQFALLSPRTIIFFGNTKLLLISMLKTYLAILMNPKQCLLPLFLILSQDQISLFLFQILNMLLGHNKINLFSAHWLHPSQSPFYLKFLAAIPLTLYGWLLNVCSSPNLKLVWCKSNTS